MELIYPSISRVWEGGLVREERGCGRLAISHSEIPRVFLAFFPTKSTGNAAHRHYVLDVGVNIFSRGVRGALAPGLDRRGLEQRSRPRPLASFHILPLRLTFH